MKFWLVCGPFLFFMDLQVEFRRRLNPGLLLKVPTFTSVTKLNLQLNVQFTFEICFQAWLTALQQSWVRLKSNGQKGDLTNSNQWRRNVSSVIFFNPTCQIWKNLPQMVLQSEQYSQWLFHSSRILKRSKHRKGWLNQLMFTSSMEFKQRDDNFSLNSEENISQELSKRVFSLVNRVKSLLEH